MILNEQAGTGTAQVSIATAVVDAGEPDAAGVARLVGLAPNPTFGATRLTFELPAAGRVEVRVFDLAGRRLAAASRDGVAGRQGLDVAELAGGRLAPGLYFVSLEFAGRRVGATRLVVLPAAR